MADQVTIRAEALDGLWETVGVDRATGIHPENVVLQADEAGPSKASFDLRRDPHIAWPDLGAFTPIEIDVDGMLVWGGRVAETPARDGAERVMSVQCDGWQYHLDDDTYERAYVHTKLGDWRDTRSQLGADLAKFRTNGKLQAGDSAIVLGYGDGDTVATSDYVGVTLDLGPASDAKYVVVEWERIGGSNADQTLYARGHDFQDPASGSGSPEDAFSFTLNGGASGTSQGGFTTARRYLSVFMYRNGAGGTYGSDFQVRLNAVRVFADAAWVSGGASVLHASDVLRDALTRATLLLSSDWSQIQDTSFAIPEFAPDSDRTPREIATAVNALHDWLIQVTADARPVFRPKPTAPVVEIGAWPGSSFEDASANSGDEIYDQVRVTGQDAASNRLRVTRSQTGTLVDRRGFHHTKTLPISSSLTTAVAQQIGDVWLTAHRTTPLKGTATITKGGARGLPAGEAVHPAVLLRNTGEMLRLNHVIDPDNGALARDARLAAVTYKPATSEAEVTLDNSRSSVEALLERLAVVTGAA
jgi:hypothetical protein